MCDRGRMFTRHNSATPIARLNERANRCLQTSESAGHLIPAAAATC